MRPRQAERTQERARREPVERAPEAALEEDEFLPYLDEGPEEQPVTQRGNRRTKSNPWKSVLIFAGVQVVILAALALLVWPGVKRGLIAEAATATSVDGAVTTAADLAAELEVERQRSAAMQAELDNIKRQLSVNPQDAWEQLQFLGKRNEMLGLADRAIQKADRAAYDQLLGLAEGGEDERVRVGANAEVLRVRASYSNGLRTASHTLPVGKLFPSLRGKDELELSTDQLVKVLSDHSLEPEYRTKAAYLQGMQSLYAELGAA